MNTRKVLTVCMVSILLLLAGCSGIDEAPPEGEQASAEEVEGAEHVVVTDSSAEVVCYVYEHAGYAGGSIDCLPKEHQNATAVPVSSVQEMTVQEEPTIIRTVYPEEKNVCYTYTHAGYAGGAVICVDFSETTFVAE